MRKVVKIVLTTVFAPRQRGEEGAPLRSNGGDEGPLAELGAKAPLLPHHACRMMGPLPLPAGAGARTSGRKFLCVVALAGLSATPATAGRLPNPIAVFNGLDKITGVTTTFEIPIGEEKRFGGLIVRPEACYTRPPTEEPKTTTFVEVDEVISDDTRKRIFSGWMFAESPGLNAVEHPIFDVWLTGCRDPNAAPPVIEASPDTSTLQDQIEEAPPED